MFDPGNVCMAFHNGRLARYNDDLVRNNDTLVNQREWWRSEYLGTFCQLHGTNHKDTASIYALKCQRAYLLTVVGHCGLNADTGSLDWITSEMRAIGRASYQRYFGHFGFSHDPEHGYQVVTFDDDPSVNSLGMFCSTLCPEHTDDFSAANFDKVLPPRLDWGVRDNSMSFHAA